MKTRDTKARRTALRGALAAGAACIAGGALAQSTVTLSGVLDGGVVALNRGNGVEKLLQSGNYYGSRLILNVAEDLGGGLKAYAYLEPGFFIDTGTLGAAFFRRSYVSLEGSFGRFDLGRDYNPMFTVVVRTDPFEGGTLAAGTSFQVAAGAQANNAIFYITPTVGGFRAKLMYAFGEPATPPNNNGTREGAYFFWDVGPVTAFGAWGRQVTHLSAATESKTDRETMLGAQYKFSGGYVTASYQIGQNNSGTTTYASNNNVPYAKRFATAMLGVRSFVPGTALELGASYQRYNDRTATDQDAGVLGIGAFYNLSKRSMLYATAALLKNSNGQRFTFVDAGRNSYNYTPAAGTTVNPRGVSVGVRHFF